MGNYTVSVFSNNSFDDFGEEVKKINELLEEIMSKKEHVTVLVQMYDMLSHYSAFAVHRLRKKGYINNTIILVLQHPAYKNQNDDESLLEIFDRVAVCETAAQFYYQFALLICRVTMAEHSDLVICCDNDLKGEAYSISKYAKNHKKDVVYI